MTLKERIEADFKQAYKDKNFIKKDLLNVVKAEISRGEAGLRTYQDVDVIALLKKMIEGCKMVGTPESLAEVEILSVYLPEELTVDQIKAYVAQCVSEGMNMGQIMKCFKDEFPGRYDGKVVSEIIKERLK